MDVGFGQLSGCLYIRDGGKSFSETWIYSKIFGITMADNKQIGMAENTFFKCPSIQYSSWKFCQPQIIYVLLIAMQAR